MLDVVPGHSRKPVPGGPVSNIRGKHEAVPVDHRIDRNCGSKSRRPANHPASEYPAAASSCDEDLLRIDVAFRDDCIDSGIEIVEVVSGIGVVNQIAELLTVARAAAGIGVEHNVVARCHDLLLDIKTITIVCEGSAVNLENQWILLHGVKVGWLDNPS